MTCMFHYLIIYWKNVGFVHYWLLSLKRYNGITIKITLIQGWESFEDINLFIFWTLHKNWFTIHFFGSFYTYKELLCFIKYELLLHRSFYLNFKKAFLCFIRAFNLLFLRTWFIHLNRRFFLCKSFSLSCLKSFFILHKSFQTFSFQELSSPRDFLQFNLIYDERTFFLMLHKCSQKN